MNGPEPKPADLVASYIVRIYRLDKNRREAVVGVVEKVGRKRRTVFTGIDELWRILVPQNRTNQEDAG